MQAESKSSFPLEVMQALNLPLSLRPQPRDSSLIISHARKVFFLLNISRFLFPSTDIHPSYSDSESPDPLLQAIVGSNPPPRPILYLPFTRFKFPPFPTKSSIPWADLIIDTFSSLDTICLRLPPDRKFADDSPSTPFLMRLPNT